MLPGLMVAGYDAWHDTTLKSASAGAVVCSINEEQTRFHSVGIIHSDKNELCTKLLSAFRAGLDAYRNFQGSYPRAIIFYRDGVGEGDIENVYTVRGYVLSQ